MGLTARGTSADLAREGAGAAGHGLSGSFAHVLWSGEKEEPNRCLGYTGTRAQVGEKKPEQHWEDESLSC